MDTVNSSGGNKTDLAPPTTSTRNPTPMSSSKTMLQFNVLLDSQDRQRLDDIAKATRWTRSTIIREAIAARHKMMFHQTPTCATGDSCRCPQFHAYGPPAPTQNYPNPNTNPPSEFISY